MSTQQVVVTPEDRGPIVNIVAWLCVACCTLLVFVKTGTKYSKFRRLQKDDYYALVALGSNLTAAILVYFEVRDGLGRHLAVLDIRQAQRFQKVIRLSKEKINALSIVS